MKIASFWLLKDMCWTIGPHIFHKDKNGNLCAEQCNLVKITLQSKLTSFNLKYELFVESHTRIVVVYPKLW